MPKYLFQMSYTAGGVQGLRKEAASAAGLPSTTS